MATLTARPQWGLFKPVRFAVADSCKHFLIMDIKVGNKSQFMISGNMHASLFKIRHGAGTLSNSALGMEVPTDHEGWGLAFTMETVQPSQDLVVQVTNNGPSAQAFHAGFLGIVKEWR